ncbi:MAG TPA: GNAT family N-acetyltransferase [Ktedonobacterales bacterium]|nr:GNAT family N-acetyltransferase [Ktedonobacterales bacterium]
MPDETLTIRLATPDDATIIAEHRARMFQDTGWLDSERATVLVEQVTSMLRPALASGEYMGWLVIAEDGAVVAGAGAQIRRLLPRPETAVEREALVVNVYVQRTYRRGGLARRLMGAILEWSRAQGIERVALHPTSMGRPLYESLGFVPSNELVTYLKP